MNEKRNAHLQRKLAQPPVPAPPAGLSERIKREIPTHLRIDGDGQRKRFDESIRMTFRVAASVLILTIGTVAMLHVLSRSDEDQPRAITAARKAMPVVNEPAAPPAAAEVTQAPAAVPQVSARPPKVAAKVRPKPQRRAPEKEEQRQQIADSNAAVETSKASAPEPPPVAAAAPTAAAGSLQGASFSRLSESIAPARLETEATVSPKSGRTMLLVSARSAPDAVLEVDGATKLENGLYAMHGERATVRLRYRADGRLKTIEKKISRADVKPWNEASRDMKDAVAEAESSPP